MWGRSLIRVVRQEIWIREVVEDFNHDALTFDVRRALEPQSSRPAHPHPILDTPDLGIELLGR